MRRREFIAGVGSAAAWPMVARAQTRNPTVGELSIGISGHVQDAFEQGLADFGYMVGQNISLIHKNAAGNSDRLNQLAAELVAAKVDVLFGSSSQPTRALTRSTSSIPIVMMSTNSVGLGLVASLARPGGNITGLSILGPEVAGKRLELLKELIPHAATAAAFWNPDDPGAQFSLAETQAASTALRINLHCFETRAVADFDPAFSAAAKEGAQAVILLPAPVFPTNAGRISELALRNRLPAIGSVREEANAGELLSFGANLPATARRAAYFIDRILRGTNPSDLPVEQPTKFELVINLKTANALGLDVPPSLLARTDEVIE
jgi:putative ABC transport system substrate-binding protein